MRLSTNRNGVTGSYLAASVAGVASTGGGGGVVGCADRAALRLTLNDHVMLPWDVWGAMARTDAELDLAFFDHLAGLTVEPDRHFGELRAIYQDPRIKVPGTVFNAVRNRPEKP